MRFVPLFISLVVFCTSALPAFAVEARLKVVATFSIVADLTRQIAGDEIDLVTLVGAGADAHSYEPTPEAQRAVSGASLIVANGLGFEPWLDRLTEAAGFKGKVIVATRGIEPLAWAEEGHGEGEEAGDDHDHDAVDPHAFQDPKLVLTYIDNIEAGLAIADPANATTFATNAESLKAKYVKLNSDLDASLGALPRESKRILTSHDAFQYFGHAYGIEFVGVQGVSTDSEPSAQDLKEIVRQIKEGGIKALFVENMSDPRFLETISADTGVAIGGELYSDSLSDESGPAQDLLSLFRHNQSELLKVLK
ncbi:metal ABC transporter solute-binding protein, Zn/Mn family [Dongia sp.]|uniref:metal ABC transporter solute-binding protein, Zn/Mn family n=1 Tax=Dongia sp. TaxID=1977262 RepID=UPI0035AD7C64